MEERLNRAEDFFNKIKSEKSSSTASDENEKQNKGDEAILISKTEFKKIMAEVALNGIKILADKNFDAGSKKIIMQIELNGSDFVVYEFLRKIADKSTLGIDDLLLQSLRAGMIQVAKRLTNIIEEGFEK